MRFHIHYRFALLSAVFLAACSLFAPQRVQAQVVGAGQLAYPTNEFFRARDVFANGDFDVALQDFKNILHRRTQNRIPGLDSICYLTMIGECHYFMGNHIEAVNAYDAALDIFAANYDWASYLRVNDNEISTHPRDNPPWGNSIRTNPQTSIRRNPFKIEVKVGTDIVQYDNTYGTKDKVELWPINAEPIFYCIALAIRHRGEILGPMSQYNHKNDDVLDKLAKRPSLSNHWTAAWVDVQYGLALSAAGKDDDALRVLEKASTMLGNADHALTGMALCEMGRIKLRNGEPKEAAVLFYEAGAAAFHYGDLPTLEESFRYGAITQRLINPQAPCPYLVPALEYTQHQRKNRNQNVCANPVVYVSLLEEVADDALTLGDPGFARDVLAEAQGLLKYRALKEGRFGGRWNFLQARALYLSGKASDLAAGDAHLETAMRYMNRCSLWIAQIRHLAMLHDSNQITTTSRITMRRALELYNELLREPDKTDWIVQPMDSLAVQMALPPSLSGTDIYELWFSAAVSLQYKEQAFEISERIRRKRFFACDPFGSRMISLRALFESPTSQLPEENLLDRQELQNAFPKFAVLSNECKQIKTRLKALPVIPMNEQQLRERNRLFSELEKRSVVQEMMLRSIALSRTRSPSVFPPFYPLKDLQGRLPEDTSLLVFFAARGEMFGFMINRTEFDMWPVASVASLRKPISEFLTALGNTNGTRVIPVKDLREDVKRTPAEEKKLEWKQRGYTLHRGLLGKATVKAAFSELVVVPDHLLWYLPFEALTYKEGEQYRPMISAMNETLSIRYAPTAALGVPSSLGRLAGAETLIVSGKLFSKGVAEKTQQESQKLQRSVENAKWLDVGKIPPKDGIYATQLSQLVVFNDIPAAKGTPLSWNPFGKEGKQGSSMHSWLTLPWGGPHLIVLPGYHSAAEVAAKKDGNGSELFYSVLAMQANGANTVLISRWNTGGQTNFNLIGEFLKNYKQYPATQAWREAVLKVANESLSFEEEPRLKAAREEEPLKANHPFFWSGFILVDRGELPSEDEDGELEEEEEEETTTEPIPEEPQPHDEQKSEPRP